MRYAWVCLLLCSDALTTEPIAINIAQVGLTTTSGKIFFLYLYVTFNPKKSRERVINELLVDKYPKKLTNSILIKIIFMAVE